jgi:uroporphyrinogen-III decarboxylase
MNHKDRFFATIYSQPVYRPATWLGLPVPSAEPALMNYFGVNSIQLIHPVQALASEMDAPNLKKHFAGKVAFCGGVDAQYLLVNGNPGEVAKKVTELKALFPTGLMISPSHESILPDIVPANIEALFNSMKTS